MKSTEFVRVDQEPVKGPDLGFSIKKHCMIQINAFTIFIIGGWLGGGNKSTATWVVDPSNNFRLKEGPSLNVPRNGHSCSKMTINGRILIVVAGGSDGQSCLDSVEILDLNYPVWMQGTKYYLAIKSRVKDNIGEKLPRENKSKIVVILHNFNYKMSIESNKIFLQILIFFSRTQVTISTI